MSPKVEPRGPAHLASRERPNYLGVFHQGYCTFPAYLGCTPGKPLTSYQVIVNLVAGTTTNEGLRILAEWDQGYYPTGTEVSDAELAALPLTGREWHPEWNYDLKPPKTAGKKRRSPN